MRKTLVALAYCLIPLIVKASDIDMAEGFFINGEIVDEGYQITLYNGQYTTRHSIEIFDHLNQSFSELQTLESEGPGTVQLYTLPKQTILSGVGQTIIMVYRESHIPIPEEPGQTQLRQEFTYLYPTIEKEPLDREGVALILVDYTVFPSLIDKLEKEYKPLLMADGYEVIIKKAPRAEIFNAKDVAITKSLIKEVYDDTEGRLKTVLLLGRIPLPYSGGYTVDGHDPQHVGAWPADSYYGDMDGEWNDFEEDIEVSEWERMFNKPGDGKFDHEIVPDSIELAIGRVDFYNMPTFSETELELYDRYLQKVIDYKSGLWDDMQNLSAPVPKTAIFEDNWNVYSNGFPGYSVRSFYGNMVSPENLDLDFIIEAPKDKVYDFAYGGASGGSESLHLVAYTIDYSNYYYNNRFSQFFGSFVGDIDFKDQIMRAVIASKGQTLTCNFGGRPVWMIGDMANGATIGDGYLRTINNKDAEFKSLGNYLPGGIHILLMGDPNLSAGVFAGPQVNVPTSGDSGEYTLESAYDFESYYMYRLNNEGTKYDLIEECQDKECAESYSDPKGLMVRGKMLIENNFGSHYELSAPTFFPQDFSSLNEIANSQSILELRGNRLFLDITESIAVNNIHLRLYSLDGRNLYTSDYSSSILQRGIDLALLVENDGPYMVVVSYGDVILHKKVFIIR